MVVKPYITYDIIEIGTHTRLDRINRVIRRELNPIHAKPEKIVT